VEEYKMRLREQAHLGWQIVQPVVRRRRISFQEWLRNLGLIEREGKEDLEAAKKKSLEIAEKIIDMDKNRRR